MNNKNFNILIVDDEKFNIEIVVEYLKPQGYGLSFVTNGKDALNAVEKYPFDLVLLDINMPTMDGYSVCETMKKNPITKSIPVIFLSSLNDSASISKGFALGGVDYINKPFNGSELIARVTTHISNRRYIKEIEEKSLKLAKLVATDQLTQAPNKLQLLSFLNQKTQHPKFSDLYLAVFSIDHVQKINELYGYMVGDRLLKQFASFLANFVPIQDIHARLFGGTFVLTLSYKSKDEAMALIKKIMHDIETTKFISINITCSVGITQFRKEESVNKVLLRCEQAVLKARANGGSRMVYL